MISALPPARILRIGRNQGKTRSQGQSANGAKGTDSSTSGGTLDLTDKGFLGDAFAERIRECVLELLISRGPGRTICVSEAAQTLAKRSGYHWHDLMRPVRMIAAQLTEAGSIEAIQHEEIVDIRVARGPVRLRLRALPGQRSAQTG
jgi:hypothetical protein